MNKTIPSILLTAMIILGSGCAPAATPAALLESTMEIVTEAASEAAPGTSASLEPTMDNTHYTIAEVKKLAGFDVREPAYLPAGVSFEYATYQKLPSPSVTLHFKLIHETYGDMGAFFQIMQEMQQKAPADVVSCGAATDGCAVLQIKTTPVVYHRSPAGPEGLDWYRDGFTFRLFRMAGEPNKVYKEELVKVVESMQE